jgi:hypothetical protein
MSHRLGFNLECQHAYGAVVNYLRLLELTQHPTIPKQAWGFCNDACVPSSRPQVPLKCSLAY